MKLACCVVVIKHCKLCEVLCNAQVIIIFKNFNKWFSIFGIFDENSMFKPILSIQFQLNLIVYCIRSCITTLLMFMHHIDFLFYIFSCANLQSALGFVFFVLLGFHFVSLSFP